MEVVKQQGYAEGSEAELAIRQLRESLDRLIRGTEGLVFMLIPRWQPGMTPQQEEAYSHYRDNPQPHPSVYVTQAELKLKEAKAYTGKLIGLVSNKTTPYANDGIRKSVNDIEPEEGKLVGVFEVCKVSGVLSVHRIDSDLVIESLERVSPVTRIDYLRQQVAALSTLTDDVLNAALNHFKEPDKQVVDLNYVVFSNVIEIIRQKLAEARFHYGFALGEIRDMYHLESTEVL